MKVGLSGLFVLVCILAYGCTPQTSVPPELPSRTAASESAPLSSASPVYPSSAPEPDHSTPNHSEPSHEPTAVGAQTRVYATDPTGLKPPTVLFSSPERLLACALSPDGTYLLLRTVGLDKGDRLFTPIMVDLTTGRASPGAPMDMEEDSCAWSGAGFWVNWLVHLDLKLRVETYPALRTALGLDDTRRQLLAASWSADGRRVAVLVGPAQASEETRRSLAFDLFLADPNGENLVRVENSVQPWWANETPIGGLALSPDGTRVVIAGNSPRAALVLTDHLSRGQWRALDGPAIDGPSAAQVDPAPPDRPRWSRDGTQVYVPDFGVFDQDGQRLPSGAATRPTDFQMHWTGDIGTLPDGRRIRLQ